MKITHKIWGVGCAVVCLIYMAGCGASGAAPSIPSQVPTTIEYASGDVIVAGSVGTAMGASIGKSGTSGLQPDGVYAVNPYASSSLTTVYSGTIDDDGKVYMVLPAGADQEFALSFTNGSSTLGILEIGEFQALPLFDKTGASLSGSIAVDDIYSAIETGAATDIPIINIGTVSETAADSSISADASDFSTICYNSAFTSSEITESALQQDLNSNALRTPHTVGVGNDARCLDKTGSGQFDWLGSISTDTFLEKSSGTSFAGYRGIVGWSSPSSDLLTEMINTETDPTSYGTESWYFYFDHGGALSRYEMSDITIKSSIALSTIGGNTTPATTIPADTAVVSCHEGDAVFGFFCGDGAIDGSTMAANESYITNLTVTSPAGRYYFPTKITKSVLNIVPVITLNSSDNTNIESVTVSFVDVSSSGSGTPVTDPRDLHAVAKLSNGGYAWLQVELTSDAAHEVRDNTNSISQAIIADETSVSQTVRFNTPISIDNFNYAYISYTDGTANFSWRADRYEN